MKRGIICLNSDISLQKIPPLPFIKMGVMVSKMGGDAPVVLPRLDTDMHKMFARYINGYDIFCLFFFFQNVPYVFVKSKQGE